MRQLVFHTVIVLALLAGLASLCIRRITESAERSLAFHEKCAVACAPHEVWNAHADTERCECDTSKIRTIKRVEVP